MDQTSRMMSNISPSCVDDMDKMRKQMMQLFEIWLKQPYFCDDQVPRRFGHNHKYNGIFDVIKNKDAQLLLSSLLSNFVRMLGPQAMQEAKIGVWRDRYRIILYIYHESRHHSELYLTQQVGR